jgi:pimeloyl-ACP methyl ester carboxylesterase
MRKAHLFAVATAALATASCAFGVNERYFFRPMPATELVSDPALMRIAGEDLITGADSVASAEGRSPLLEPRLPITLAKDIRKFGGVRIALAHARAANAKEREPLIVHCGGAGADMINRGVYYVNKIAPWGELLMWDYPGFGHSLGTPTADSFDRVFAEMAPWIDAQAKGRPLVIWGHSIGGLVCARLASKSREVDAIILETTALSTTRLAKDKTWAIPVIDAQVQGEWKTFDIPQMLDGFSGPVLVIGAGKDNTLPAPLAREVDKALKDGDLNVTYVEYAEMGHLNATVNSGFAADGAAFFASITDTRH